MATTTQDPLSIPPSTVDFQQILQLFLQRILQYNAWKDVYESGTGTTIAELIAGVTTFLNLGIPVAQRETYLLTARRDSSIYALAATLGVRLSRKVSASTQVVLSRQGDISLPLQIDAYTAFTIGGKSYFNREPIIFPANVAQISQLANLRLYEGSLEKRTNFTIDELPGFRRIALGLPGFSVSDTDVRVKVNGEWWTTQDQPMWSFGPADKVVNDATNGYGDTEIIFGDGFTGKYLDSTDSLEVHYVVTTGALGNGLNPPQEVECASMTNIKGVTVTPSIGGADEKDAEYYRYTAPYQFRSKNKAVNPAEHIAIATRYPLVADVLLQAQRDIAPYDIRWKNTIRMILLPYVGDALEPSQKQDFLDYFEESKWVALDIDVSVDPQPVVVDVVLNAYILPTANAQSVRAAIVNNVQALFERKRGVLGRKLVQYDISKKSNIEGLDYIDIITPTGDVPMPNAWSFAKLGNLVVNVQITNRRI